jgi:hypothetical protein
MVVPPSVVSKAWLLPPAMAISSSARPCSQAAAIASLPSIAGSVAISSRA